MKRIHSNSFLISIASVSLFMFAALTRGQAVGTVPAAETGGIDGGSNPRVERVAPGIWRVRYGTPEAVTPLTYRSAGPRVEGLGKLPAVESPPLPADSVGFQISARGCSVTLPRDPSEHLYGLGLNTHQFEMTNQRAFIVPSDHPEQPTNESHAPVPFYVSTRGYGVYVDTARFASFYMGDVDAASAAVGVGSATTEPGMSVESLYKSRYEPKGTILVDVPAARGVDVYLFAGPTMLDAVRRYNLFAGGGAVPPLWGLGITYRGQSKLSAEESLQLAKSFRDEGIPCDQWGIEPGWQSATYSSSFVWSKERYPDPDGFVSGMHGLGFRLNAWQHAFVHPISPLYEPLRKWSGNYRVWNGLVPDFATSQGRSIFVDQQEKVLFSKGVDGVKLDECDYQPFRSEGVWSFPEASVFPSGLDGEQMHSLFGELYQQAMLGPFQRRQLRTWGLVRNSHALASPLPYVVYSDSYDHACYIRGLAKSGFCGLLWTPEVRNAQSLEDLYRRVETVIFSPYALINCWYMRMPPWVQIDRQKNNAGIVMPEHQEATETIRRLFKLRMSLIPYLYAAFNEYRLEGTPPVRALVMDWPGDARTALVDNEFMFGRSLLVAPLVKGESHRTVYLPGGEWYDFWSGKRIAGGQSIDVSPPVDQIPLFVRGDTLLPLAEPVEHVGKETQFQLHVHVFGAHPEPMALFDDDGVSEDYGRGVQNRVLLSWDGKEGRAASAGEYGGVSRYRVVEWITEGK